MLAVWMSGLKDIHWSSAQAASATFVVLGMA